MRTLRQLHDIENKRVLLRVDWNVPVQDKQVLGHNKIIASLETILYLIHHQARVIIATHLGRPEGRVEPSLRMGPLVSLLQNLLDQRGIDTAVRKMNQVVGEEVRKMVEVTKPGEILVLENIRFDAREEQNDPQFSAELASIADIYVNDAFGVIHRAHASTVSIAKLLPSYAGLLVESEVKNLERLLHHALHPFVVVSGGAKPNDKLAVIKNLASRVELFLVAGMVANTFLKADGFEVKGSSVGDNTTIAVAKKLLSSLRDQLVLPIDFIWEDNEIRDIGPRTVDLFEKYILQAKTIFWNGNLGRSEDPRFAGGTRAIAKAIAASQGTSVVGGGDTVTAVEQYGLDKHISFVSTGGGATLEFLAGKSLPGLEVLGYRSR
jgi:phosphoglycerate kinase